MTRQPDLTFAAADALLFELALVIVPADVSAAYSLFISRLGCAGYCESMLSGHARSLESPDLSRLFRCRSALDDVEAAAAEFAPRIARDPAASGAEAVSRYKRGIAEQLAAVDGHALQRAAKVFLGGLTRDAQLEADRQAALEAALAERLRIDAELRAKEQTEAAEREAAESAEEEAQALAQVAAYAEDERRRVRAVVQLRRRLRASKLPSVRIARNVYDPRQLAVCVGDFNIERVAMYIEALDAAEAEAS